MFNTITETARSWLQSARHHTHRPAHVPVEQVGDQLYLRYDAIELDLRGTEVTVRYLHRARLVAYGHGTAGERTAHDLIHLTNAQGRIPVTHQGDVAHGTFPQLRLVAATAARKAADCGHIVLGLLIGAGVIAAVPAHWLTPIAVAASFALFASSYLKGPRA